MNQPNKENTYHLWELTSKDSSKDVYELAQMVAAEKAPNFWIPNQWDDEAQTVVYALHRWLWEQPRRPVNDQPPYTHTLINGTSMATALKKAVPGAGKLWADHEIQKLTRTAYSILSNAQLLMRMGGGAPYSFFLIRAWPDGYTPQWYGYGDAVWLPYKEELDIAKQQKKAEELAGPIKVYSRVDAIPQPEPNPKSVMAYLEKVVALVRKLETENAELRTDLEEKIAELDEKNGWDDVVANIAAITGGDGQ